MLKTRTISGNLVMFIAHLTCDASGGIRPINSKETCNCGIQRRQEASRIVSSFEVPATSYISLSTAKKISTHLRHSTLSDISSLNLAVDNVLSNQDLTDGTVIAIALAFLASFLQGRSPSASNIKLWPGENRESELNDELNSVETVQTRSVLREGDYDQVKVSPAVFDGDEWKDISKPENYLLYTSKLRTKQQLQKKIQGSSSVKGSTYGKENRLIFFSLLVLFVPVFSVEFFFALSRQFICGDFVTNVSDSVWLTDSERALSSLNGFSPWALELCSPHLDQ